MKKNILIVEDNYLQAKYLSSMLREEGCHTTMATLGEQALKLIDNYKFELILLDLELPDTNGANVLAELRQRPDYRHTAVIVLSATSKSERIQEMLELGANDYIIKPFDQASLKLKVRNHLALQEANAALEERVREQERLQKQLQDIFDHAPSPMLIVDTVFKVLKMNKAGVELFNSPYFVENTMLIGQIIQCKRVLVSDRCGSTFECVNCMLYRSLKVTEETQLPIHKEECDIQVLRKGESHTLSFLISTSIIVIDAAPSILIALDDISAQKHAQRQIIEQNIALHESNLLLIQQTDQLKELTEHLDQTNSQLQSSEAMYRLLAENVSDVIWVFDINTLRFKYISPSAFQLQGYTSEEVLVLSLEETVAPDYLPELFARFRERYLVYIEQNIDFPEYVDETQLICKNGQRVWVEISTRFVRGIEGVEVVGISRNIENRKKAEATITQKAKELTALNATKDKLFSIIGHDLKNPFSLILNYANRLTRQFDTIDDKKKYEYVKGISETAQESYQLLQNLLAWSQSQKGGLQLDRAEIDLAAIFADAFALYKHVAEKKGIELKNEIPRGAFVLADLNTTDTVFRNLVSNAIKYTPKGGNIAATSQWVATHPDYPWPHWLICVTDTGVGISETVLDKLFQIGTSTSSPGTDNEHGTGLGLVVCKDFITLNKGVIWIESALGKGTTVQIRLASMQTVQPDVLENESLVTESSPIYEPYDYRKLELDTRIVVKIRPFYELAMDTLSIRAIRQFLQKAQELAAMYEHDALAIFAQQVEDALKRFDIPEIEKLLQSQKDRLV